MPAHRTRLRSAGSAILLSAVLGSSACAAVRTDVQTTQAGEAERANAAAASMLEPEGSIHAGSGIDSGVPGAATQLFAADHSPDRICTSDGWSEAVSQVLLSAGQQAGSGTQADTGRGCRTTATTGSQDIDVRMEVLDRADMAAIAPARNAGVDVDGDIPELLGFEELAFEATGSRVSSSLLHPELDRVEEHRWIAVDGGGAFHLVVAVEPDGAALRDDLLEVIEQASVRLEPIVAEHVRSNAEGSDADDAVQLALEHVLLSIIQSHPLDDATTPQGLEAISFEYAFPENIAGIAPYRDDVICARHEETAECRIEALASSYRFRFVDTDNRWLLDDFEVVG